MRLVTVCLGLGLAAALVGTTGCDERPPSLAGPVVKLPPRPPLSSEQGERRERTRRVVEGEGIPFNTGLPGMEPEAETKVRSVRAIAERIVGITVAAAIAQGAPRERLEKRLAPLNIRSVLTEDELAFLDTASPTDRQRAQFSWGIESAAMLLWAIGLETSPPGRPDHQCDFQAVYDLVMQEGVAGLETQAKIRNAAEVLDALDLVYCYHWAVVEEVQINGRPVPGGLSGDVLMERHRALNWLTCYMDQEWDDVSTDT